MKTAMQGIIIFLLTGRAHNKGSHGSHGPIIRNIFYYGKSGSAISTIGKRITIATVVRIQYLSRTRNLAGETLRADIVVAAVGKAEFIKPDMVNENSVLIDVGTNFTEDGKMVGDVSAAAREKVRMASAVPGGVGVITVAELFMNLTWLGTGLQR